jgi:hypothetical protein
MGRELNETPFMKKILTSLAIATSLLSAEAQTNQTNGQPAVQLAWNPITSLDSHGNPVQTAGASYTLSWGTNSGQYMWTAQTTNAFQPVSNLLRGVTYYFSVYATVGYLSSTNSAEITYQVMNIPSAPSGFTIIVISH